MYQKFYIHKYAGTYADTLEAYGLGNLLKRVVSDNNITIFDRGAYFEINLEDEFELQQIKKMEFKNFIPFIMKDANSGNELHDIARVNYSEERSKKKEAQLLKQEVYKNYNKTEQKKEKQEKLDGIDKNNPYDEKIDIYAQLTTANNYVGFLKIFHNFYQNKEYYKELVLDIFDYYSRFSPSDEIKFRFKQLQKEKKLNAFEDEITAIQLYNPNQGRGLNKSKANGLNGFNFKSLWIVETMKLLGTVGTSNGSNSAMICQLVKVGSSYDLKIAVPVFKSTTLNNKDIIFNSFKANLKGNTPIAIDILNILNLTKKVIENSEEYKTSKIKSRTVVKEIVSGLQNVYQKDLGNNRAVVNISFSNTPDFVEYESKLEADDWIEILDNQIAIIGKINEQQSDATLGLLTYRNFIGSSRETALNHFSKFSYWYASYLMHQLSKNNKLKSFKTEHLDKLYKKMKPKLSEIISNEGFKAVALAIRNSTVRLQRMPKDARLFEIRYGFVQDLQNSSRKMKDFLDFIGEFVTKYNADTAKYIENKLKKQPKIGVHRAFIKQEELDEFYALCEDDSNSSVIASLLSSYGFATDKIALTDEEKLIELADKLGYILTKNDEKVEEIEQNEDNQEDNN